VLRQNLLDSFRALPRSAAHVGEMRVQQLVDRRALRRRSDSIVVPVETRSPFGTLYHQVRPRGNNIASPFRARSLIFRFLAMCLILYRDKAQPADTRLPAYSSKLLSIWCG
jgi:hypothetical protein